MAKKSSKKKSASGSLGSRLLLVFGVLTAIIFLPSTFLLMIGMLPTPFAAVADRAGKKSKVISVGAINLAGCTPFLFELWEKGNDFAASFSIVSDPQAIVGMYSAAAAGYLVSWAMTGIVSSILYQKGQARLKQIEKEQKELIERWGREVTGEMPLDEFGFPLQQGVTSDGKKNPRSSAL